MVEMHRRRFLKTALAAVPAIAGVSIARAESRGVYHPIEPIQMFEQLKWNAEGLPRVPSPEGGYISVPLVEGYGYGRTYEEANRNFRSLLNRDAGQCLLCSCTEHFKFGTKEELVATFHDKNGGSILYCEHDGYLIAVDAESSRHLAKLYLQPMEAYGTATQVTITQRYHMVVLSGKGLMCGKIKRESIHA